MAPRAWFCPLRSASSLVYNPGRSHHVSQYQYCNALTKVPVGQNRLPTNYKSTLSSLKCGYPVGLSITPFTRVRCSSMRESNRSPGEEEPVISTFNISPSRVVDQLTHQDQKPIPRNGVLRRRLQMSSRGKICTVLSDVRLPPGCDIRAHHPIAYKRGSSRIVCFLAILHQSDQRVPRESELWQSHLLLASLLSFAHVSTYPDMRE